MTIVANVLLDWKIFVFGFGLLVSVCVINTKFAVLPVSCLTFIVTTIFLWFTSMCVTFVCLHKLLQKNDPLDFVLGSKPKKELSGQRKLKPNSDKVKQLTTDIDRYFISKWYNNISVNEDFTKESQLLLAEIITRLAEVQLSVNNKILLHGVLNIYLRHLKEFRRSLKRREKYPGSIEELYRYSHVCSSNSKAKDYFLHQLTTNLLRHFINSELWNSLPCQILVSILARRLTSYILQLISDPEILNYALLDSLSSKEIRKKYNLELYTRINITNFVTIKTESKALENNEIIQSNKTVDEVDSKEEIKPKVKPQHTTEIALKPPKIHSGIDVKEAKKIDPKKIDVAEELKEKPTQTRLTSDPVKIYEPKRHRSTKTWNDSKDLVLGISLGQDPLDALPVESVRTVGKSTFWDTHMGKVDQEDSAAHAANVLLNEVKHTTQTTMEDFKKSIKPISDATVNTLHNIKDLQETTMNNALHKIGDFQDEAAGMVEGILDFGRAGLRKGLRLTGLQDNIENAKATLNIGTQSSKQQQQIKRKISKTARSESPEKIVAEDNNDTVWMNPLQMDSPNFDGQILLEKTKKPEGKREMQIPFISMEQPEPGFDSPDPEYEDTADLASSIAKLRSLLQQRSSESGMSTPALSPIFIQAKYFGAKKYWVVDRLPFVGIRPPDEISQKSTTELESVSDLDEVDGVMPSFYKFCAKTATGVLDKTLSTIKTALPSNPSGVEQTDNAWIFVQEEQNEADILTRMKKLLTERKEYCTLDTEIDTAYEAIDSLDTLQPPFSPNVAFEDELDAFEVNLPITKSIIDIICELLADTDSPFIQEPLVKVILLSLGNTLETFIISEVNSMMESFCVDLMTIPDDTNQNVLKLDLEAYLDAILKSLPDAVKVVFGRTTLKKALGVLVSSLQVEKINQDVLLQVFELVVMKLIEESNQVSPPTSA